MTKPFNHQEHQEWFRSEVDKEIEYVRKHNLPKNSWLRRLQEGALKQTDRFNLTTPKPNDDTNKAE